MKTRATAILILAVLCLGLLAGCTPQENQAITWQDPFVEAMVRDWLDKPEGDITPLELEGIETLHIVGDKYYINSDAPLQMESTPENELIYRLNRTPIDSFKGPLFAQDFTHFGSLTELRITHTQIRTLDGLSSQTLSSLLVEAAPEFTHIGALGDLPALTDLGLMNTALTQLDGKGLDKLPLEQLTINWSPVEAIDPAGLPGGLKALYMRCTAVKDFSFLPELGSLVDFLANEYFDDVSLLASLPDLEYANLRDSAIDTLDGIESCSKLQSLDITNTSVRDISPLAGLQSLTSFWAHNTKVQDWAPVEHVSSVNTTG